MRNRDVGNRKQIRPLPPGRVIRFEGEAIKIDRAEIGSFLERKNVKLDADQLEILWEAVDRFRIEGDSEAKRGARRTVYLLLREGLYS